MLDSFIDEAMIIVASGSGGNGCVSFYRGPFVPYGGPDGGHGGRGGSVIVAASSNINTLYSFKRNRRFMAEKGKDGSGGNCTGASGKDLIILLPVGTQIFDTASGLLLADLSTHGQKEVLLHGGSGGAGNIGFKNSYNQAPRTAIKGEPGCELRVLLQLKLLSDVGIVGLPNVGKSTLLSKCSRSPTKIASYAFTTLSPKLGVVFLSDYEDFVMADLPGLVEGASEGFGCGIRFLKHVERCSLLLHVIDATSPDPLQDYQVIRHELHSYSKELLQKEEIVAISKIDEVDEDCLGQIRQNLSSVTGKRIFAFSALLDDTISDLMHYIYQEVKKQKVLNHNS